MDGSSLSRAERGAEEWMVDAAVRLLDESYSK
jgi:hypothetical protein